MVEAEQDARRDAAFQDAWEASFTRLGLVNNVSQIAQSFYGVGYADGVAQGRAEAWREIAIIAGDSLPRDWEAIRKAVAKARD